MFGDDERGRGVGAGGRRRSTGSSGGRSYRRHGCAICDREIETTTHHLTPRGRSGSEPAEICSPCHRQIHTTFTHHELKHEYDTVEELQEADRLQGFVDWVRTTDKTTIKVDETERVRNGRR